jgi:hypothetical protein
MDILNFISWIKGKRVVTTVDPAKTLLPLGLKDGRRDDEYLAGAITVEDFAASIVTPPAYKVYTATLTQTGTDPATITVLENTIDPGITFETDGGGTFLIISPFLISFFITNGYHPPRLYLTTNLIFAFVICLFVDRFKISSHSIVITFIVAVIIVNIYFITNLFYTVNKIYKHDKKIAENIDFIIQSRGL